jgi:hypothetical protein
MGLFSIFLVRAAAARRDGTARKGAREPWSTTAPIRQIFQDAFAAANLAYANPHSYRKTLARFGERLLVNPFRTRAATTKGIAARSAVVVLMPRLL